MAAPLHADAEGGYVIPAGQEELVLDMLGRGEMLPGDCKLMSASIDKNMIVAPYECGGLPATVRLEHPSAGTEGPRTEAFVLSLEGNSVPGLLEAIEAAVRRHEGGFRWLVTTRQGAARTHSWSQGLDWRTSGLLGILASLGLVGSIAWKRRRPSDATPQQTSESASSENTPRA